MSAPPPGLYVGRVMHARVRPARRFAYRVFWVLVDIDRPLDGMGRLFSHNRMNLLSFRDRDHGARDGTMLRPWVEEALRRAGIGEPPGEIRLLCFPRLWGFVFNPLSVFTCYAGGKPFAVVYEVHNTLGEAHAYVARLDDLEEAPFRHAAEKVLYVSPLIGMEGRYEFALRPPGESLSLAIRTIGPEGLILTAAQTGRYRKLTTLSAIRAVLGHPLMTLKVLAAIHWEALGTWLRGARSVSRSLEPAMPVSRAMSAAPRSAAPAIPAPPAERAEPPHFLAAE